MDKSTSKQASKQASRLIFKSLLVLLFLAPSNAHADLMFGLVGWWRLQDGAIGTTCAGASVADSSGQGNTGTCNNSPIYVLGMRKEGLSLNGINNYISIPKSTNLNNIGTIFTVSTWVNPSAIPNNSQWFTVGSDQTGQGWGITLGTASSNTLVGAMVIGGVAYNSPSYTASTGNWYNVILIRNGTTASFYVNGTQVGSSFIVPSGNVRSYGNAPTYIGDVYSYNNYYNGIIDDVRIYNRALSAQEVVDLYNSGASINNGSLNNFKLDQ